MPTSSCTRHCYMTNCNSLMLYRLNEYTWSTTLSCEMRPNLSWPVMGKVNCMSGTQRHFCLTENPVDIWPSAVNVLSDIHPLTYQYTICYCSGSKQIEDYRTFLWNGTVIPKQWSHKNLQISVSRCSAANGISEHRRSKIMPMESLPHGLGAQDSSFGLYSTNNFIQICP